MLTYATDGERERELHSGLENLPEMIRGGREEKNKKYDRGGHGWQILPDIVGAAIQRHQFSHA